MGELADHWAAAVASADAAKAIHYTRLAADRALERLAPQEAVRWYRQALDLQGQALGAERCELLISLGEAERQGGDPGFRQALLDAAALARELGDTDRLGRAVLANSRGFASRAGGVDSERVQMLEAAVEVLPQDDPRRAPVFALLASELLYAGRVRATPRAGHAGHRDRQRRGRADHARTHDPPRHRRHLGADTLQEREALGVELLELAQRLDDPRLSFMAAFRQQGIGLCAADRPQAESALRTMRALAASVPEPAFCIQRLFTETIMAIIDGDLSGAEKWVLEAFEAGTTSGQPDAPAMFALQLANVRYFQGRLGELAQQLVQVAGEPDSSPGWDAAAARALIEGGRADEARELALAEDLQSVPWDSVWSPTMFVWADTCSRLGIMDRASEAYELLQPFPGQLAAATLI